EDETESSQPKQSLHISENQPEINRAQVYEPVPNEKKAHNNEQPSQNYVHLWDALSQHRHIVLIGQAGAGKTTTIRYLALALSGERGTDNDPQFQHLLPIVADLAKYEDQLGGKQDLSLAAFLCKQPTRSQFQLLLQEK